MQGHYDSLIIGAGMSGLSAGIRLAHFGRKVCIVEKHSLWGGLNSFYKKGGRPFDVGLHAMTNYVPKLEKSRRGPLAVICRQLRIDQDELALKPQLESLVHFPSVQLRFSNDFSLLVSEVEEKFPDQILGFLKLCEVIRNYDDTSLTPSFLSARMRLGEFLSPLLVDLLFCPLMFYGSATENDMDWHQFTIMFKSIFFEGFCRPEGGVRRVLDILKREYLNRGGELALKSGVHKMSSLSNGKIQLEMENGHILTADSVFSSAGRVETLRLLGRAAEEVGVMTFVESIFCLDQSASALGWKNSIVFYSHSDSFSYKKSSNWVDTNSGIICCPENFEGLAPLPEGILRVTSIANFDRWNSLSPDQYLIEKNAFVAAQLDSISGLGPDFRKNIVYRDSFTPLTIKRFTSHEGGAVYGSVRKQYDGLSGIPNVYLIGTDQGYLGITGALLSGVMVANRYGFQE